MGGSSKWNGAIAVTLQFFNSIGVAAWSAW
jgi:hypothetical protein